jgi:hypothetical protein
MLTQDNSRMRVAGAYFSSLHHSLGVEERIEIRHKLPGEGQPMCKKFFAHPAEAARYATTLVNDNVYAGVAPRYGKDGTKAGVTRLPTLYADLDLKDGHTCENRLQQLRDLLYFPSILVWTGAGFHVYFLLKEPAEGSEELARAELVMRHLAEGLEGDPVHDRSRILRVPGTFNLKYGEPRAVKMERCEPGLRYGLDELEKMAEGMPRKVDGDDDPGRAGKVRRDILSGPIGKGERNLALVSVAGSLRDRGLDSETMCMILLELNRLKCEPPLGEQEVIAVGRSVSKYAAGSPRYRSSSARRVYGKKTR